jgi:hypothetical protein
LESARRKEANHWQNQGRHRNFGSKRDTVLGQVTISFHSLV